MSWTISSKSLTIENLLVQESIFSLANGYLGVRGNFEEGYKGTNNTIRGTYLNAFHELVEIPYGEKLYGFPSTQQKIVNMIDTQTVEILLGEDEERFSVFDGDILSYERNLYLDKGYSERMIHWRSPKGREVKLHFTRLVSFERKELFTLRLNIEPVNYFGQIKVMTTVNGNVVNYVNDNDPRVGSTHARLLTTIESTLKDDYAIIASQTKNSNLQAACVTKYIFTGDCKRVDQLTNDYVLTSLTFDLNKPITIEKRNIYVDSLRHGTNNLTQSAVAIQNQLKEVTFKDLLIEQERYLQNFWTHADIQIHGDEKVQEGIRFNLYHLHQAAGRDTYSNISAKGLSGEGYEGHYFWDTEIYMLPVFIMTKPDIARQLLLFRYSLLDSARNRAKEMGHSKGALFPWRTISGGECSSYFPAGTAQYHISADIAYSFVNYYLATGDEPFLVTYAAEVLFETARLWMETGHFNGQYFKIDAVTGPDEYTAVVNNNYYTNLMAKFNLAWAVKAFKKLQMEHPQQFDVLVNRIGLENNEPKLWEKAADRMYLPFDEKRQINAQDDSFLQKDVWDFENTPQENYPLLLHYHPLTLYRYQVCKQADTVLAHFLLEDEANEETIKNSYHYYEKLTTHDSSLSSCIFSIMGAKIGDIDKAYQYFIETARLDLDNTHGNTKDGLHMANMGGTWLAIVYGFAGLRVKESGLYLNPKLPNDWDGYECSLHYHGRQIKLKVARSSTSIEIRGKQLDVFVDGKRYELVEGQPVLIEKLSEKCVESI